MEKAYKFRIYPNKTQESLLQKTFGCVRFIYNYFLDRRIKAYEQNKNTIGYNECSKELTQLKKEKKWLKEPDKSSLQNALKNLDTAYKNFFNRQKVGFPKFKSKKNRYKSYKTNMTNNNIVFLGNKIKLPKIGKIKSAYKNTEVKDLNVIKWNCPECKTHHDKDVNVAINIRDEGLRILNIA